MQTGDRSSYRTLQLAKQWVAGLQLGKHSGFRVLCRERVALTLFPLELFSR